MPGCVLVPRLVLTGSVRDAHLRFMVFGKMPGKVSINLLHNPLWTQPCEQGPWVPNDKGQAYCAQFPTECARRLAAAGTSPQQYTLESCVNFDGPHLLLSNFHIVDVEPRAFQGRQLASLSLADNALTTLQDKVFNGLRVSGDLNLRNNGLGVLTLPMLSGVAGA